jgi:hypothetical protein
MAGYGERSRPNEGILDPLYAYAVVFEEEDTACGLVVGDLIGFPAEVTAVIRRQVERLCGLPARNVLVCATHTHWGPEIRSAHVPAVLLEAMSPTYSAALGQQAASALAEAWRRREPAIALCGTGDADLLSFNRRTVGRDGKTVMSWRMPLDQAILASRTGAELASTWMLGGGPGERLGQPLDQLDGLRAGVTDPAVPVLKLVRPDGSPIVALFAFACHAVCGAGPEAFYLYSFDYPGHARRVVETVLGCPAVFLAGCCGDQVPLRRDQDARKRVGESLGAEVIRAWELIEGAGIGPLRVASRMVNLPSSSASSSGDGAEPQDNQFGIWSMALGDAWGLVGLPGEVLVEIGLQIKQGSPFGTTAVVELGLDDPGYVPTDAAIEEGGYESSSSPFGRGTEAALVDGGRAALRDVAQ